MLVVNVLAVTDQLQTATRRNMILDKVRANCTHKMKG